MAGGKASKTTIQLVERRQMALEMRKAGASYRQIAAAIRQYIAAETGKNSKYNHQAAYRDVLVALREVEGQTAEAAAELIQLQLSRYDDLQASWWDRAQRDKDAAQVVLSVLRQRGDFLAQIGLLELKARELRQNEHRSARERFVDEDMSEEEEMLLIQNLLIAGGIRDALALPAPHDNGEEEEPPSD